MTLEYFLHLEDIYAYFAFDVVEEMDVVGNQNDTISTFVCFDEEVSDFLSIFPVKVSCWFVSNDKFRGMNHSSGDSYFLFFPSRDMFAIGFGLFC
jgi:hypothetical protein